MAKNFIEKAERISTLISERKHENTLIHIVKNGGAYKTAPRTFRVIVSEEKETLVLITPEGRKIVKKPMEGEKFDPYIGFALAYIENEWGVRYMRLRDLFDVFTKSTKTNDVAINFVCAFVEAETGIDRNEFARMIEEATMFNAGKIFEIEFDYVHWPEFPEQIAETLAADIDAEEAEEEASEIGIEFNPADCDVRWLGDHMFSCNCHKENF